MDPKMTDCLFEASGPEEEVFQEAKEHWTLVHGLEDDDFTPEVIGKIKAVMKDDDSAADEEDEEEQL